MTRYAQLSGTIFALVAVLQLVRILRGWPIVIDTLAVPLWASGCAFVVASALAIWGFRSARGVG